MNQQAYRIPRYEELDDSKMCYWYDPELKGYYLYIPRCGLGNLSNHQVVENLDGTITVSPSIKVWGHDQGKQTVRHGYLVGGMWQGCSDDWVGA